MSSHHRHNSLMFPSYPLYISLCRLHIFLIFRSVYKDFLEELGENYHVRWELVKSSSYGIPQNRPRLFMVGLNKLLKFCEEKEQELEGRSEKIVENMMYDKKNLSGKLNFILCKNIGNAFVYNKVKKESIKKSIN